MKRTVIPAVILLIACGVLSAVGTAAAQEPIRIGVLYGLGGAAAPYTKPAVSGHEMAVEEINAKGGVLGRKLQLVVRDDQSKPDVGVREARDLILKEKVNFLSGIIHSGVALAVSEVAKEHKTILLVSIAKTAALTEDKGHRYVFRSTSNSLTEGRAAAILMAQQPFKRYAVTGPDYEYGHRIAEDFVAQLKKLKPDVQIVAEVWPKFGERDFTPHINALLQAKPEMVFSSIWGGDHIAFVKQAKPYGFFQKTQYMAISQADLDVAVPLGAEAPEGMWASANYAFYYPDSPCQQGVRRQVQSQDGRPAACRRALRVQRDQFPRRGHQEGQQRRDREGRRGPRGAHDRDAHRPRHHPRPGSPVQSRAVLGPAQEDRRLPLPDPGRHPVHRRREDHADAG